jgi:hypothetical protein
MHLSRLISSFSGRRVSAATIVVAVVAALAGPAASIASAHGSRLTGRALGVLHVHGRPYRAGGLVSPRVPFGHKVGVPAGKKHGGGGGTGGTGTGASLLTYHGGGIFSSAWKVYDIYWVPPGYSIASGYQSAVDGFWQNVAAASGQSSNVFSTSTQYTDASAKHVVYNASFGGSVTVSDPFPASGCSDSGVPSGPCISDMQVSAEIQSVAAAHGWTVGYPNIFNLMMPKNVGNCATSSTGVPESFCSFAGVCAWHHQWNGLFFVVQPYVGTFGGCSTGQNPIANYDGEQAINTLSHEVSETITDPAEQSWYDSSGNEIGDKCAWNFGTPLGGSAGAMYNQVINGADYMLQQEWSNATSKCVQRGS